MTSSLNLIGMHAMLIMEIIQFHMHACHAHNRNYPMSVGRIILFDHLFRKKKNPINLKLGYVHMLKKKQPYMYLGLIHLVKRFIAQIVVIF